LVFFAEKQAFLLYLIPEPQNLFSGQDVLLQAGIMYIQRKVHDPRLSHIKTKGPELTQDLLLPEQGKQISKSAFPVLSMIDLFNNQGISINLLSYEN
jgi:hypothetical protein